MAESVGTGGNVRDPGLSDSAPSRLNTSVEREESDSEDIFDQESGTVKRSQQFTSLLSHLHAPAQSELSCKCKKVCV